MVDHSRAAVQGAISPGDLVEAWRATPTAIPHALFPAAWDRVPDRIVELLAIAV